MSRQEPNPLSPQRILDRVLDADDDHEVVLQNNGQVSLRDKRSGELMHSVVGPREEATTLYVEQSRLSEKLQEPAPGALAIWDIGLGAGSNALAALQCIRQLGPSSRRRLEIHSFETIPSGLALALKNRRQLPFFEGLEEAAEQLLRSDRAETDLFSWRLWRGDFRETVGARPSALSSPEIVFFDFYSPKAVPELWAPSVFAQVRNSMSAPSGELFTYSSSTRVRTALLLAGFFVGAGSSTGAKRETTVGSTSFETLREPLGSRWLARLERSHEPIPPGWQGTRTELLARIRSHPQFQESRK